MMKTKKFLTMLAAMLLMSVCTFAQNDNTPLKGDVNEDGTVDVADLVSVIQIMKDAGGVIGEKMCYWYAGVNGGNAVTEANFTDVASKIVESQIPETGFVTASGQYVYIVMPETRYLSSLTDANGNVVDYDCTDAYGYHKYHIYKTKEKYSGKLNYGIDEAIYYWYVGYDQDAYDHPENFKDKMYTTTTNATPTEYTLNGYNGLDISNTGEHPNYLNMIIPSSWEVPTLWGEERVGQLAGAILKENVIIEGLPGTYKVWGSDGKGVDDNIIYINLK